MPNVLRMTKILTTLKSIGISFRFLFYCKLATGLRTDAMLILNTLQKHCELFNGCNLYIYHQNPLLGQGTDREGTEKGVFVLYYVIINK